MAEFEGVVFAMTSEPRLSEWVEDMDMRISQALNEGWTRKMLRAGSYAVLVTGWRAGSGFTNTIRIIETPAKPTIVHVLSREQNLDAYANDEYPSSEESDRQ